ncbi:hypothetical protein JCGZ_05156 [Jatropha curcas]|uniref:Uncharacterized protein n=1 Tax=Jatropha curcas TaxID=180498 RepID=A0A067JKH6_JATCU|nr:hypothetical protein JCGZ_05156 [Jatropha curcas]
MSSASQYANNEEVNSYFPPNIAGAGDSVGEHASVVGSVASGPTKQRQNVLLQQLVDSLRQVAELEEVRNHQENWRHRNYQKKFHSTLTGQTSAAQASSKRHRGSLPSGRRQE